MKHLLIVLLMFLSTACVQAERFTIGGLDVVCVADDCPNEAEVGHELQMIHLQWHDYVDAWDVWDGWTLELLEPSQWSYPGAKGVTLHQYRNIQILVDEDCPKGLCPGVFDWELGLPLAEFLLPYSTELEKLEFRTENDLL